MKDLVFALLLLYFLYTHFLAGEKAVEEYTVIWEFTPRLVAEEVNSMIKKGWSPLGGITGRAGASLYQAMVKYEWEAEE